MKPFMDADFLLKTDTARKLFEAISRSTRADLSAKADEVLAVLDRSPNALLFW